MVSPSFVLCFARMITGFLRIYFNRNKKESKCYPQFERYFTHTGGKVIKTALDLCAGIRDPQGRKGCMDLYVVIL
ncbi:hypothetical protein D4758_28915 [Enterocloster citroniae]|nr:hypothetical protein [Enterocloster citroniae]